MWYSPILLLLFRKETKALMVMENSDLEKFRRTSSSLPLILSLFQVLMELSRRRWPVLDVSPLQDWRKRDIVEAFSRRSIVGRRSSWGEEAPPSDATWGSKMMRRMPTFLTGMNFEEDAASEYTLKPGLVLFPSMVERILSK